MGGEGGEMGEGGEGRGATPTVFHPMGGPNTPFLLLSNLERMMFWVWLALVWAEKLINTGLYTSFGRWRRRNS